MIRTLHAAVFPDGSGLWALGETIAEARAGALDRREYLRDCARSVVYTDFPPPATDSAWADRLLYVTMTGTTEALRAIVKDLDGVIPWCPVDLYDYPKETT